MNPLMFAGIGEVLFDVFEDGTETVGGAPLNFAVHIHQLGGQFGVGSGTVVSCINADRRGINVIDALCWRGMSTCYIGMDSSHPTGLASVVMRNGEPGYQIEADAAWDYMTDKPALKELAGTCHAVCYGSLAQRSSVSRATIRNFLRNAPQAIRLYDVNLRRNTLTGERGYSPEIIAYSCREATVIKANQTELFEILDLLGIDCPEDRTTGGIRRGMEALLTRFPARAVVVTRGAKGTIALTRDEDYVISPPVRVVGTPHPVGAGDACSAGIVFGLTLGWDIDSTMELANRMGADVAAHESATPPLSSDTLHFAQARLGSAEAGKNKPTPTGAAN